MSSTPLHFADRRDAGVRLAKALSKYRGDDVVIYALPRGGVPVGAEIALQLKAPLSVVIPRKIGHPENEEYAVCAVTEEGELVCDEIESHKLNPQWLEDERKAALDEVRRRRAVYEPKRLSAMGKVAIIVDDGIATGLTMRAAIRSLRSEAPSKIIVAAPMAPADVVEYLQKDANEVIVLDTSEPFLGAIGAYYDSFPQVADEEVLQMLSA